MRTTISPDEALVIIEKYNKEPFHIRHAITVSKVLEDLAKKLGYEEIDMVPCDFNGIKGFHMVLLEKHIGK